MTRLGCFWVIESPRSTIDRRHHRHIIFRVAPPDACIAGPFISEDLAIAYLNRLSPAIVAIPG